MNQNDQQNLLAAIESGAESVVAGHPDDIRRAIDGELVVVPDDLCPDRQKAEAVLWAPSPDPGRRSRITVIRPAPTWAQQCGAWGLEPGSPGAEVARLLGVGERHVARVEEVVCRATIMPDPSSWCGDEGARGVGILRLIADQRGIGGRLGLGIDGCSTWTLCRGGTGRRYARDSGAWDGAVECAWAQLTASAGVTVEAMGGDVNVSLCAGDDTPAGEALVTPVEIMPRAWAASLAAWGMGRAASDCDAGWDQKTIVRGTVAEWGAALAATGWEVSR